MNEQLGLLGIVALAALFGAVIGFEREYSMKPAGLRTHTLVASASAALILLGDHLINDYVIDTGTSIVAADPVRVIQSIIVGVSFIGGGVILKDRSGNDVVNLTTATSILFSAVVGISTALHLYYLAVGLVLIALVTNHVLYLFDSWIEKKRLNSQNE